MTKNTRCPCGDGAYETCCAPFHRGQSVPDAERLMRARYSAFALGDADYLWRTLHSSHDDRSRDRADWSASFAKSEASRSYRGLRIVETRPPDDAGVARVLFLARIRERGRDVGFAELSYFAEEDGDWRYITGVIAGGRSELSIEALED